MTMDYQTSDIGLSAYLMMQGFKLISAKKLGNGRFEFTFEDTSSYNHYMVVYDSGNSTSGDRIKLYVNLFVIFFEKGNAKEYTISPNLSLSKELFSSLKILFVF